MSLGMIYCSECKKRLCLTASRFVIPPLVCFDCEAAYKDRLDRNDLLASEYRRAFLSQSSK